MTLQRFAITVDYPDSHTSDDVREWISLALAAVAGEHHMVVASVGSHCYGHILKVQLEINSSCAIDGATVKKLLATSPGRGPKLTGFRAI
ncbi:MAG: hypothetical protein P4N59_06495 [Negativicutes bacterium]|nr:hypothetical protein [Negativicutes bacterium]